MAIDFGKNLESQFSEEATTYQNEKRTVLEEHAKLGLDTIVIYKSDSLRFFIIKIIFLSFFGIIFTISPFTLMLGVSSIEFSNLIIPLLSAIAIFIGFLWWARFIYRSYLQSKFPFMTFSSTGILFGTADKELPWLNIENHTSTITTVNYVRSLTMNIDLKKGIVFPVMSRLIGVNHKPKKNLLVLGITGGKVLLDKKTKMTYETLADTFHTYWLASLSREELKAMA